MRIAIIENNIVTNVIVGEPEIVADLFSEIAVETQETNLAWIGARWNGVKFEAQKTFDSWTWNESTFEYDPPKPKPEGDYEWHEIQQEWVPIQNQATEE